MEKMQSTNKLRIIQSELSQISKSQTVPIYFRCQVTFIHFIFSNCITKVNSHFS